MLQVVSSLMVVILMTLEMAISIIIFIYRLLIYQQKLDSGKHASLLQQTIN